MTELNYIYKVFSKGRKGNYNCHIIMPSAKCNMQCKYCLRQEISYTKKVNIDIVKLDNYLSRFDKNTTDIFQIWGGEPLVNPEFKILVNYLRNKFKDSKINTIINGTLLNDELEKYI